MKLRDDQFLRSVARSCWLIEIEAEYDRLGPIFAIVGEMVEALQIDREIWVFHAFQKKSKSGIATPNRTST